MGRAANVLKKAAGIAFESLINFVSAAPALALVSLLVTPAKPKWTRCSED